MSPTGGTLAERLGRVHERIERAGGDPARVRLVAVTKQVPAERVAEAVALGCVDLAESYAQEMVEKVAAVEALVGEDEVRSLRWHFIGALQRNKVRLVAPDVALWQSVDRLSVAAEIARRAPGASVLVQVNVSGADTQGGCRPAQVGAVVEGARDLGLEVRGLMCIGARGDDEAVRAGFRLLRELADRHELPERSMGMSGDLELAVAEGATLVRVGTALFGPRRVTTGMGK